MSKLHSKLNFELHPKLHRNLYPHNHPKVQFIPSELHLELRSDSFGPDLHLQHLRDFHPILSSAIPVLSIVLCRLGSCLTPSLSLSVGVFDAAKLLKCHEIRGYALASPLQVHQSHVTHLALENSSFSSFAIDHCLSSLQSLILNVIQSFSL